MYAVTAYAQLLAKRRSLEAQRLLLIKRFCFHTVSDLSNTSFNVVSIRIQER